MFHSQDETDCCNYFLKSCKGLASINERFFSLLKNFEKTHFVAFQENKWGRIICLGKEFKFKTGFCMCILFFKTASTCKLIGLH